MYRVNLLPPELALESERTLRRVTPLRLLMISCGILGFLYLIFVCWLFISRAEVEAKRQALAAIEPQIRQVEVLQNRANALRAHTAAWQEVQARRQVCYPLLTDFQRSLPADMWLTRVEIAPPAAQAPQGASGGQNETAANPAAPAPPPPALPKATQVVIEGGTNSLTSVGVYINNLCRLPHFKRVALKEVKEVKGAGQESVTVFTIEAALKGGE